MKKTIKKIGMLMLFCGAMIIVSCNKDKYQPKGDYQPAGNYGNANIKSSTSVTLNNWSSTFDDGINYQFESSVNWGSITQAIKDNGIVMAYLDDGSGNWQALPYTDSGDDYYSTTINFNFTVGKVTFQANGFDDNGSPTPSSFNGLKVRIVAISSAGKLANPNLDYKNYTEVKKTFNLDN